MNLENVAISGQFFRDPAFPSPPTWHQQTWNGQLLTRNLRGVWAQTLFVNVESPQSPCALITLSSQMLTYYYFMALSHLALFAFSSHYLKGHFTHETESLWPLQHSHWWKRQSRSKFASQYTWGTNRVCDCKMDVKSTWIPTWHRMDHVTWSLGLFSRTTSWR